MSRFRSLLELSRSRRTETAILVGFVVLLVVIAVSGWRSAEKTIRFMEVSDRSGYYGLVAAGLEAVIGDITEAESEQRAYVMTGNAAILTSYDAALVRVREGFEKLAELTARDSTLRAEVENVKKTSEKRLEYLNDAINLYRTGHPERANEYIAKGRPLSLATRAGFEQVQKQYEAVLTDTSKQAMSLRQDAVRSVVVTFALAVLVLALMAAMVIFEARFIRALSERLRHESRHDELTGLPNRAYFNEWLARSIASAKRAGDKLALLYIDLNGFKRVNDTLGHGVGDEVLFEVSRKLEARARDADFVARVGGDEFAVIIPRVTEPVQVEAAVARFSNLEVLRGALTMNASVGRAIYPDDADSAEALIHVSDSAMYERKLSGRR